MSHSFAHAAFTLVELLISLALMSLLLAGLAGAVSACMKSYAVNQEQATLISHARVALNYVTTLIRTNDAQIVPEADADEVNFQNGQIVTCTGLSLRVSPTTKTRLLRFDAANQQLFTYDGNVARTLASGVMGCAFKLEPMRSATAIRTGGKCDLLQRANINLTIGPCVATDAGGIGSDDQTASLSASVMPRRNTW